MYKSKSAQLLNPSYTSFQESVGHIDPWRSKIDTIGRSKGALNRKYKRILAVLFIFMIVTYCIVHVMIMDTKVAQNEERYYALSSSHASVGTASFAESEAKISSMYNFSYPFTKPKYTRLGMEYQFGIITDMDQDSKTDKKNTWQSMMRTASIIYNKRSEKVSISWNENDDKPISLYSSFANGGRGMELSELLVFNGRLYSVDDRTGIVYEIENQKKIFPWVILSDGDGHEIKGFKGEWMVRKGEKMIVGGIGKEWTTPTGQLLHHNPQWVKIIEHQGHITHHNWTLIYMAMQKQAGYPSPGYIIHESAAWSDVHNSWFFLPRRASREQYNDVVDEERGTNILFKCSEDFSRISHIRIGELDDTKKGYSSFKFLPDTGDRVIVALKTYEYKDHTKSFITVFTIDGKILLPDTIVSDSYKYEGLEFL